MESGEGLHSVLPKKAQRVGVLDLQEDACQQVVNDIQQAGGQGIALAADVRNEQQVSLAVEALQTQFGICTVLVNNAAVMPSGQLHETALDEFDHCLAVNLRGAYLVSRAVIPGMLEAGTGSIIHMASVTGLLGLPGLAVYSGTKAALIGLARAMSTDYAGDGIRVNSVSPGTIDSPMLHNFVDAQSDPIHIRRQFDEMHPIGRVGTIDEVASVCVFLASDEASFVTGSNYEVDGGLSSKGQQPQD